MGKITIPEVLDRFRAYRDGDGGPSWGSLHIVLADGNIADSSVKFCLDHALNTGDCEGASLAKVLMKMSKTQRAKLPRCI